ncbi:MAG: response regulator [Bacteroidota bacterium]
MKDNYTILYVDDEPDNLLAFKVLFRRKYNVVTTADASEALELLKRNTVHLILSDYKMPVMTGVELLSEVAHQYPEITRFIVTGFDDQIALSEAVQKGTVNTVINKPWEVEELDVLLARGLENA